jgi:hypothetical protein
MSMVKTPSQPKARLFIQKTSRQLIKENNMLTRRNTLKLAVASAISLFLPLKRSEAQPKKEQRDRKVEAESPQMRLEAVCREIERCIDEDYYPLYLYPHDAIRAVILKYGFVFNDRETVEMNQQAYSQHFESEKDKNRSFASNSPPATAIAVTDCGCFFMLDKTGWIVIQNYKNRPRLTRGINEGYLTSEDIHRYMPFGVWSFPSFPHGDLTLAAEAAG